MFTDKVMLPRMAVVSSLAVFYSIINKLLKQMEKHNTDTNKKYAVFERTHCMASRATENLCSR